MQDSGQLSVLVRLFFVGFLSSWMADEPINYVQSTVAYADQVVHRPSKLRKNKPQRQL